MAEITNKTLLMLALIMILISLGGTWLSLSKIESTSATGKVPAQIDSWTAEDAPELNSSVPDQLNENSTSAPAKE